jgi:hypothetical protein
MLDIKVTHGSYWYGAQLPYWIYIALTVIPFTGLFGLDHLALRSPLTALLKGILNVPLLGYWYFYDIAQALGERDRLEKHGIAVPFYGPTGIGAGIFSGNKKIPVSPKQVPRPWTYMIYVLTTCFFIAFPINKLVIGDYWGALAQVIMYLCFFTIITPILAVAWGLYDIYRVGFDTKGLFEKGPARFLPASWIISPYFKRDVLGPFDPNSISPSSWLGRVIEAWWEVPIQTGKAVSNTIAEAGKETTAAVAQVGKETNEVIKEAGDVVQEAEETAKNIATSPATGKLVNATLEFSKAAAHEVADAAKEVGDHAINTGKKISERVPVIVGKVATGAVHDIAKDTVEPITKAVIETKQEFEKVANNATRIAGEVTQTAKNVAQNAKNTVSEIGNKALNTADNISHNAREIVNATAGPMPGIVANYANQAKQVGTNVAAQATEAGTHAIQNATQVAKQTTNAIQNTAQAATQAANTAVQNASQAVENTSQALQNTSQAATQAANAAIKNASQAAQETARAVENTTVAATQATANAVQGTTEALAQNTRNMGAAANATTQAVGKNTQQLAAALNATAEQLAKKTEQSTEQVVSNTAQGVSGLSSLAAKVPQLGQEIATELPNKMAEHAKVAAQAGGAILATTASSSDPSFTVIIVLFSLGFVAMSGYLFYTLRNLDKQQVEKSDDPPGEPRAVRESDKPRK